MNKVNNGLNQPPLKSIPPAVARLIPPDQLIVTKENLSAYSDAILRLEESLLQVLTIFLGLFRLECGCGLQLTFHFVFPSAPFTHTDNYVAVG